MATKKASLYLGLVAAVVLWVGCGPKEQAPPDGGSAGSAASTAAPRSGTEAGAAEAEGQGMADAARKAVEEAAAQAEASKVNQVVEGELEELKTLVDEKKYQEASAKLAGLAEVELTPSQQQLLDRLKAEVEKGLAGQAVESGKKALGGLLQGN